MSTFETLNGIFRMVFDDDDIQITPEMTANDIEGWDSLSHVNLITTVEARFEVRFTHKELLRLKSIGDLLNTLEEKLSVKSACS